LSKDLAAYRWNPKIQNRLGLNYRVNLHVGLHAGWSFEGAMGSEYKIDASYISPNVAVTAQVETATQHFRVPLLVTDAVLSLCSKGVVDYCRLIDNITTVGHPEPMELYCVDLDTMALEVDRRGSAWNPRNMKPITWNPRTRYKARQFLEAEMLGNWANQEFEQGLVYQTLYKDDYISQMRVRYSEEFVEIFKMGQINYQHGEWPVAHQQLIRACTVLGERDGPSESILDFMQQRRFVAPANWQGHRDLEPLLVGPPQNPPRPDRFSMDCLRSTSQDEEPCEMQSFDADGATFQDGGPDGDLYRNSLDALDKHVQDLRQKKAADTMTAKQELLISIERVLQELKQQLQPKTIDALAAEHNVQGKSFEVFAAALVVPAEDEELGGRAYELAGSTRSKPDEMAMDFIKIRSPRMPETPRRTLRTPRMRN